MSTPQQPPGQRSPYDPQPGQGYIKLRPAHDFLKSTDEDLLAKADECLSRAGSALDQPPTEVDPSTHSPQYDDFSQLRLFLEAQSCLAEVLRRQAMERADRDKKEAEDRAERDRKRETRHFWIEILVVAFLIGAELWVSIYYGNRGLREGREQSKVLAQMQQSTAATADAMNAARDSLKSLADAQAESLRIFQQQQADRAKKPTLALNVGRVPLLEPHAIFTPTQETDGSVTYHLDLWNRGDVTANKLYFRALVSAKDVSANSNPPGLSPESDPTDSSAQSFIFARLFVRSHSYDPIDITFFYQKGHTPFQVTFKADSEEVRTPTFLGVLPVTPRTPSN